MTRRVPGAGRRRRILYAAAGLAVGDAALLLLFVYNAWRVRAALLGAHMGQPQFAMSTAFDIFTLYAVFSVFGWVLAGLPLAAAVPARVIARIPWPASLLLGAALGPFSLLLTFVLIALLRGTLAGFSLAHSEALWPLSMLVSTIAFAVYAALVRRSLPAKPGEKAD